MANKKICVFGDSVGKGMLYDSTKGRYVTASHPFFELLQQPLNIEIDNFCRFGCTITKGAEIVTRKLTKLSEYDKVILQYGGNDSDFDWSAVASSPCAQHDCKTPIKTFFDTYSALINNLLSMGIKPIIMNLVPVDCEKYFRWIAKTSDGSSVMRFLGDRRSIEHWNEMYNNAVWSIAAQTGTQVIDIRSPLLFKRDFSGYMCEDGIHPNEDGHRIIAQQLLDTSSTILAC